MAATDSRSAGATLPGYTTAPAPAGQEKPNYLQSEMVKTIVVSWPPVTDSQASLPKLAQFAINGNSPGAVGERLTGLIVDEGHSRWVLTDVTIVGKTPTSLSVTYGSRQAMR